MSTARRRSTSSPWTRSSASDSTVATSSVRRSTASATAAGSASAASGAAGARSAPASALRPTSRLRPVRARVRVVPRILAPAVGAAFAVPRTGHRRELVVEAAGTLLRAALREEEPAWRPVGGDDEAARSQPLELGGDHGPLRGEEAGQLARVDIGGDPLPAHPVERLEDLGAPEELVERLRSGARRYRLGPTVAPRDHASHFSTSRRTSVSTAARATWTGSPATRPQSPSRGATPMTGTPGGGGPNAPRG